MHPETEDKGVKNTSGRVLYLPIRISFESYLWEVCQQNFCLVNYPFLPFNYFNSGNDRENARKQIVPSAHGGSKLDLLKCRVIPFDEKM